MIILLKLLFDRYKMGKEWYPSMAFTILVLGLYGWTQTKDYVVWSNPKDKRVQVAVEWDPQKGYHITPYVK